MNSDPSPKSWNALTALARQAPVPQLDVSLQVMQAIRRPAAPLRSPSVLELLDGMAGNNWLRGSLAVVTALAAFLGYQGLENVDTLLLALGFSL